MISRKIYEEIENCFEGIRLGEGIGHFQAIAIDNFTINEKDGQEKLKIEIQKDRVLGNDWKKLMEQIETEEIDWFGFPFMSSNGILFIIPSLLVLEHKEELNRLLKLIFTKSELWEIDIWNQTLNRNQRDIIIKVYELWNHQNLEHLKSYGMSNDTALMENSNNEISQVLELLLQRQ
jgi:hypothetical protein